MYRALRYLRHSRAIRIRQCTRYYVYATRALTDPRGPFMPRSHNARYIMLKSVNQIRCKYVLLWSSCFTPFKHADIKAVR